MPSTFGPEGIVYNKYSDHISEMNESIVDSLGESINLDKDSFIGFVRDMVASAEAQANEIGQQVYDSGFVSSSSGVVLDGNVGHVGMERSGDSYSTIEQIQLTAIKACTVPAGTRYRTANNVIFATDTALIFTGAGTDTVEGTCTVPGPNNVEIGELAYIVNSVNGITTVTNLTAAVPGTNRQTDAQLKEAHTIVTETSGEDDAAGIYEALYEIPVSAARIIDNDSEGTSTEDGTTPPHSIRVIVIGGSDADVAEAINNNITTGVTTYGSESEDVYNSDYGYTKTIHFDRGAEVSTRLTINITKYKNFPDDGEQQISSELADVFDDYTLGSTADHAQIVGACYQVAGLKVNSIGISKDGAAAVEDDVLYDVDELPSLDVVRDSDNNITEINIDWVYS